MSERRRVRIVASQGDQTFLVAVGRRMGRVYDALHDSLAPEMPLQSILARGGWEKPEGELRAVRARIRPLEAPAWPSVPPPIKSERRDGPTPAGGAYSVAHRDERGHVFEIVECDDKDQPIARTYTERFTWRPGDVRRAEGEREG